MRLGLSRSRKKHRAAAIFAFVFACMGIFAVILIRMKPAFAEYAGKYADNIAYKIVNEAVAECFSDGEYSELTYFGGDSVKTVETNAAKVNKLKSDINITVQNKISEYSRETIDIPIGTASGVYFLAGVGPKIPIKIYPAYVVNTDFREEFNSAGINQVRHKIYIDVSIEMSFTGFVFSESKAVSTAVLVSDTVIIGNTPMYYGNGILSSGTE